MPRTKLRALVGRDPSVKTASRSSALGCKHKTVEYTLETIAMEKRMAIAADRSPRTPCACCGGGVAVGGVDPCVICYQRERGRRRKARRL